MKRFVCIFMFGGTDNFYWQRALPVDTKEEAMAQAATILKMGRPAFVEDYDLSMSVGVPAYYSRVIHCHLCNERAVYTPELNRTTHTCDKCFQTHTMFGGAFEPPLDLSV